MTRLRLRSYLSAVTLIALIWAGSSSADDASIRGHMHVLANGNADARYAAAGALVSTGDARLESFFESYLTDSLYLWNDVLLVGGDITEDDDLNEWVPLFDPLTRTPYLHGGEAALIMIDDLEEISPSRKERSFMLNSKHLLRLSSSSEHMRLSGAKKCGNLPGIPEAYEQLQLMGETDPVEIVRRTAQESARLISFQASLDDLTSEAHMLVVQDLAATKSIRGLSRIEAQLQSLPELRDLDVETRDRLEHLYASSIETIKGHISFVERCASVFQGLSLGSVLVLMALGLAITFGLMGVINMAHGEFMMLGAYATYEVQCLFNWLIERGVLSQSAFDWYYVAALPVAFLAAGMIGLIVEVSVIRFLYRKPLESLLATWGVGLVLIQLVRLRYGDNIGVTAPMWARGGIEIIQDVVLPYSRCFIIALCAVSMSLVYILMGKTRIGLRMRATMQNRDMAKGLGVNTQRVDRFTFAFGSGLAGIAGYAWTLIGGVTPDMGQKNFIIDSFLVVVTGGVGELAGVIFSGIGIGILTKFVEPLQFGDFTMGAIWAKVTLLVVIAIFIQFKPAGLFAPKGRLADV
ncbi:MAG: urea ABC transporter permease subunit UrtB [Kiritimatiellae bacterium]|nr:urea ABC transporter permease subunit UrtB [Kiritimatiellia bacterium]